MKFTIKKMYENKYQITSTVRNVVHRHKIDTVKPIYVHCAQNIKII